MPSPQAQLQPTQNLERLAIETLSGLLAELKQGETVPINPGSELAAIGVDSLARMELLVRLEKAMQARLPEALVLDARTVRDLISALAQAGNEAPGLAVPPAEAMPRTAPLPTAEAARSWAEVLEFQAQHAGARSAVHLFAGNGDWQPITYADLLDDARGAASGYLAHGVVPQQPVAIMLPTGREFFAACYGAWLAGAIPVPLYPPARLDQIEDHLLRQAAILNNCEARVLVASAEILKLAPLLRLNAPALTHCLTPEQLGAHSTINVIAQTPGDALALLQYTSGSTGTPKPTCSPACAPWAAPSACAPTTPSQAGCRSITTWA